MKTLCAVYCRLSNQGEDSESIERQIKLGTEYAKQQGLKPVLFVEPPGARSGFYEKNRPAWQKLKKEIETNPDYAVVFVSELSRASRNVLNALLFADLLNRRNVDFVAQGDKIDTRTATGRLIFNVSSAVSEWERAITSERKKRQYAARDKTIYSSNVHPFGLKRTGSYPNIKWETTADFPTIIEVLELYLKGYGTPAIAIELNRRGRTWINRKLQRVPVKEATIRTTLDAVARYKPFLPPELYNKVIAMRERKHIKRNTLKRSPHPPPLLRGILYCSLCGALLTATTNHQVKSYGEYDYKSYRHRVRTVCRLSNRTFRADVVDPQVWQHLDWLDQLPPTQLDEIARAIVAPKDTQAIDYTARREKLTRQLNALVEMRAAGEIEQTEFVEARDKLRAELAATPEQVAAPTPEYTYDEIRPLLDHLCGTLQISAQVDPVAANRAMVGFLERVEWNGLNITRVKWNAPFEKLNEREVVLPA